ncbi:MAG: hypothetical protein HY782_04360 [Chloroflexi bacterium]|nr:hypothetical protein [Chloroflexota bacterium]
MGRFIQPDPLIPNLYNPQSLNRYSYARNNPLRYNDPTGYAEIGDAGGGGMDWPPPPPDPFFSTDGGGVSDPVAPTDTIF